MIISCGDSAFRYSYLISTLLTMSFEVTMSNSYKQCYRKNAVLKHAHARQSSSLDSRRSSVSRSIDCDLNKLQVGYIRVYLASFLVTRLPNIVLLEENCDLKRLSIIAARTLTVDCFRVNWTTIRRDRVTPLYLCTAATVLSLLLPKVCILKTSQKIEI